MAFPGDLFGSPAIPELDSEFIGWPHPGPSPGSHKHPDDNQLWSSTSAHPGKTRHTRNHGSCSEGCPHAKLILCILRDMHAHAQQVQGQSFSTMVGSQLYDEIQSILAGSGGYCDVQGSSQGDKCTCCRTTRMQGDRWKRTRSIIGSVKKALSIKSLKKTVRPNPRKRKAREEPRSFPLGDDKTLFALPGYHDVQSEDLQGHFPVAMELAAPCRAELWGNGEELVISNPQASPQLAELPSPNDFDVPYNSWDPSDPCRFELPTSRVTGHKQQSHLSLNTSIGPSINFGARHGVAVPASSASAFSDMTWNSPMSSVPSLISPNTAFSDSCHTSLQSTPISARGGKSANSLWAAGNMRVRILPAEIGGDTGHAGQVQPTLSVNTSTAWTSCTNSPARSAHQSTPSSGGPIDWYAMNATRGMNTTHKTHHQDRELSELPASTPVRCTGPFDIASTRAYDYPAPSLHLEPPRSIPPRSASATSSRETSSSKSPPDDSSTVTLSRPQRLEETFAAIVQIFGDGMVDIIRQLPFHDTLLSGISTLENLVRKQALLEGMVKQHRFIYLVAAMAKEMRGWLPDDFHLKFRELSSHVSTSNRELSSQALLAASEYLLAGLEVHMKSALKPKATTQCRCLVRDSMSVESLMPFFQKYRSVSWYYMGDALKPTSPINFRDLELSLMTAPFDTNADPSCHEEHVIGMAFFEQYLSDVRTICNKHTTSCSSRLEHQLEAISFLRDFFTQRTEEDVLHRTLPHLSPESDRHADKLATAKRPQLPTPEDTAEMEGSESNCHKADSNRGNRSPLRDRPERRFCDICHCPFGSDADRNKKWKRHLQSDRHLAAIDRLEDRTEYMCPFSAPNGSPCRTGFNRRDNLQAHAEKKHGRFLCVIQQEKEEQSPMCMQVFATSEERERHKKQDHERKAGPHRLQARRKDEKEQPVDDIDSPAKLRRSRAVATRHTPSRLAKRSRISKRASSRTSSGGEPT